jgi:nicotinamide mononucleotide transporter PnuC
MKKILPDFTKAEKILWLSSITIIAVCSVISGETDPLSLTASVIGATSIIFGAKGHFFGPLLAVIFSIMYGIISYSFGYYGEMITYLGMTGPMALLSLIAWLRNPFKGKKTEVRVNTIKAQEWLILAALTVIVTIIFYYILRNLGTANLIPSTFSVTTSFAAVYLTERRSSYFSLAYAFNDAVLIILWILASLTDVSYVSVTVCFVVFLINDLYGFISWKKMEKRQKLSEQADLI